MKAILKLAALLLVLVGSLGSCKETVTESLQILIQNKTDSIVCVRLFPNDKYITPQDGFVGSDVGGGSRNTEYTLPPNEGDWYEWSEILFSSGNLNIEPYALATDVFDSIYISTADKEHVIIKFTHENVTGYSENIFSEHSTWGLEIVEYNLHTQYARNPHRDHQYRFHILKDKIINQ